MQDRELLVHVKNALDWEPSVDGSGVAVAVDDGVVTLRGDVSSYVEKHTAERTVLHVYGVKAVANDLVVRIPHGSERSDTAIAQDSVNALSCNSLVPADRVTVSVANGWVTLNGTLDWYYQIDAAERTVRNVPGVKGVSSAVVLQPLVKPVDVHERISAALHRSAEVDARRIAVVANEGQVILTGHVRSFAEREAAERAAWSAPGVTSVDDRITVVP
jgi:osmotically-inducible protein OsmY